MTTGIRTSPAGSLPNTNSKAFPFAWLYFVPFILISAFTILNLFIGIIVNSMQALHWEEEENRRQETEAKAHAEREEMLALIRETAARLARIERRLGDES